MAIYYTCTVSYAGPATDLQPETAETGITAPVIWIGLSDVAGFSIGSFFAAQNAKDQMLSVALAAITSGKQVLAEVDPPSDTPIINLIQDRQIYQLFLNA
jgi:hypothetical protein